jgi:hypothetical protein
VYDEPHRDYHRWNTGEESYRAYLAERQRDYRAFGSLERSEQNQYWDWRHNHRDADREKR